MFLVTAGFAVSCVASSSQYFTEEYYRPTATCKAEVIEVSRSEGNLDTSRVPAILLSSRKRN
jgi:hypothetical protein